MSGAPRQAYVSANDIAEEIVRTRARMSQGLARLDRDYALRPLLIGGVRAALADIGARTMADRLRRQVLPLTLISIGVLWLNLSSRGAAPQIAQGLPRLVSWLQRAVR